MKYLLRSIFIALLTLSMVSCDQTGTTKGVIIRQFPLNLFPSNGENNSSCYVASLESTEENIKWTRSLPDALELEVDKAGQLAMYLHKDNKNVVFSKSDKNGTKSLYVLVIGKRDHKEGDSITINVENDVATIAEEK